MTATTVAAKENETLSDRQAECVVFTVDPAGRVSSWNAEAQQLYGWRADEIIGQPCRSLLSNEGDQDADFAARSRFDRAAIDGWWQDVLWGLRNDRTRFRASILISPLRDPAGTLVGFAHVTRDLSARVQMAHDFNNLSQVSETAIEALRRCLPAGSSAASRLLEILKRNVGLASDTMRAVLEAPAGDRTGTTAAVAPRDLAGLRVLVIEDESLIAMHVEDLLGQLGCEVVGFAGTVEKALASIASLEMDMVLLDMNLHGMAADPVAEATLARGVRLVFMSGDQQVEKAWPGVPKIRKPFELGQMRREMERALMGAYG